MIRRLRVFERKKKSGIAPTNGINPSAQSTPTLPNIRAIWTFDMPMLRASHAIQPPTAAAIVLPAKGMTWEARNIGMSKVQMARMFGNVGVDWALGMIPFVGAIPDFFFRSNTRNLRIIKRHLDKHHPSTATLDL